MRFSTLYRLKKIVKKHRARATAVSLVAITIVASMIGITWGIFRANIAETAALQSETKAVEALGKVTKERDAKDEALAAEAAQREIAERRLVEGILRPIGYGDQPNSAQLVANKLSNCCQVNNATLEPILRSESPLAD